MKIYIRSSQ